MTSGSTRSVISRNGTTNLSNTSFDSSLVTRSGYQNGTLVGSDVTRGKRKGVIYIIKVL